jgi:hypothetical protein
MIRTTRATPKSARGRPKDIAAAVQEKLDATPERLARAREAGETPIRDSERLRRILDPFDTMRANRLLAPHDQKLNDIRWLVGESLRRTHQRARLDTLRAVAPDRLGSTGFGPRPGLPQSEAALHARDKLRKAEDRVGPAAWPIVTRIIIEGAGVRDCRGFVPNSPPRGAPTPSSPTACGSRSTRLAACWGLRPGEVDERLLFLK